MPPMIPSRNITTILGINHWRGYSKAHQFTLSTTHSPVDPSCVCMHMYVCMHVCLYACTHVYLLEVTKQQMCMKYCSSVLYYIPVAGLLLKCWSLYKLVVYFQHGHCPTSNKSPRQDSMSPCRAHAVLSGTCNILCI